MSSDFLWYLPTHGDGRDLLGSAHHLEAQARRQRPPTQALGIDTFILSAYPNLEEAVRVGEDLLPLLRARRERGLVPRDAVALVSES